MNDDWPEEIDLSSDQLHIHASDVHHDDTRVELGPLCQIALETLRSQGIEYGHVDLIIIDSQEMASMNHQHMGQSGPTDVLSFPLDGPAVALGTFARSPVVELVPEAAQQATDPAAEPPVHLGDIVISAVVARKQAAGHAGSEAAEFALLTIHGILHILGHDHVTSKETLQMQQIEREQMSKLGFEHPVRR